MIFRLIAALALCIAASAHGTTADPATGLPDQYGNTQELSDFTGEAVLAIVVTTRKMVWIGRWEEAIRQEIPELVSIRVADLILLNDNGALTSSNAGTLLNQLANASANRPESLMAHDVARCCITMSSTVQGSRVGG